MVDPGGCRQAVFTITVANTRPPQITSTPVTTAQVGAAYGYDVNATDAERRHADLLADAGASRHDDQCQHRLDRLDAHMPRWEPRP